MTTWHAAPDLLARFATAPESIDDVSAASVEAHLLACDQCRRQVASAAEPAAITAGWEALADRIDQAPRPPLERLLSVFFPDHVARVVAATPALQLSWLSAVVAVVAAVVVAARQAGSDAPFLILAPLVPLAGVAASFGPAPDPAGEAAVATPVHGAGLVLRRSWAVVGSSLAVLLPAALALPGLDWRAVAWVLPSLALALGALALSTWVAPLTACGLAAFAWMAVLQGVWLLDGAHSGLTRTPVFAGRGQLAFLVCIGLALAAVASRRMHLSTLEAR